MVATTESILLTLQQEMTSREVHYGPLLPRHLNLFTQLHVCLEPEQEIPH